MANPGQVPTVSLAPSPTIKFDPTLDPASGIATSSSFDWWPFPSQGVATGIPTPTTQPGSSLTTSSSSFSSQSTALPLSSVSSNSSSSTNPFILITASRPGPSASATYPPEVSRRPQSTSKIIYLIPALAVVGGIIGAVVANWIINRWIRRRRRRRRKSLRAVEEDLGPSASRHLKSPDGLQYDDFVNQRWPGEEDSEKMPLADSRLSVYNRGSGAVATLPGTPSSFGPYVHEPAPRSGSWLHRAISSASKKPRIAPTRPAQSLLGNIPRYQLTETYEQSEPGSEVSDTHERFSPRTESDRVYDSTPADTLRHKSIRRGIIQQIQSTSRILRSNRDNSSVNRGDSRTSSKSKVSSHSTETSRKSDERSLATSKPFTSNTNSRMAKSRIRHERTDSDVTIQPSTAAASMEEDHSNLTLSESLIPVRISGSVKRINKAGEQSFIGLDGLGMRFSQTVLAGAMEERQLETEPVMEIPKSPPTVWSPSLESELIFSPMTPLSTQNKQLPGLPPQRPLSRGTPQRSNASGYRTVDGDGSTKAPSLRTGLDLPVTRKRTLHGPRTPSRDRPTTPAIGGGLHASGQPTLPGGPRNSTKSSQVGITTNSPAQRFHARRVAHKNVESILSKHYAEKSNASK